MHIVIIFINIGSYHAARLKATYDMCQTLNWQFTAIQVTDDTLEHSWGDFVSDLGIPVKTLLTADSANYKQQDAFSSLASKAMIEYFKVIRPDVVLIPGWSFAVAKAALKWCRQNQAKPILMSESNEDDAPRIWWKEKYKSWIVSKYNAALVGGSKHQAYLNKLGMDSEAVFHGYDVVNNEFFNRENLKNLSQPITKPYFLTIGRLIPKKNFFRLLEAYADYREKTNTNSWDLVICGSGQLQPQIEKKIESLNLEHKVHLTGFITPEGLLPYFAHAGCFIHASTTEQWGLVVNEAMAASLPVIVSHRCGCFEDLIVEGVNGFGFDPYNPQELANIMAKVSSDTCDRQQIGQAAFEHIQKFAPKTFANGLKQAVQYATTHC